MTVAISSYRASHRNTSSFPQLLVIPPHQFRISLRHRVAFNWCERVFAVAAREFFGDVLLRFHQRLEDLHLHERPFWRFAVAFEIEPHVARLIQRPRELRLHLRHRDNLLNIAQPIRPFLVVAASEKIYKTIIATAAAESR